jgi:NitT/TauT family transport system substrate-binding protein
VRLRLGLRWRLRLRLRSPSRLRLRLRLRLPSRLLSIPVLASLVLGAACGGGAAPAKPAPSAASPSQAAPFAIGIPDGTGTYAPIYIARNEGFFKRDGLAASIKVLRGSGSETPAIISGSVQLVVIDPDSALGAMAKGVQVVLVGDEVVGYPFQMWGKPSLKSVADLRGRRLGLLHVGSLSDTAAHQLLPMFGLSFKDVHAEYLGNSQTAVAGLLAGKVDAVIAAPPAVFKAKQQGFRLVYDLLKIPHVATQAFEVGRSYLKAHPDRVEAFLKGYMQGVAFLNNPADKRRALADISKYTAITNRQLLDETYGVVRAQNRCDPTVMTVDLGNAVKWVAQHEHRAIDPARTIDGGPMRHLQKGGFVKRYCGS